MQLLRLQWQSVLTVVLLYSIIRYVLSVDITEESWLSRRQS